jgi:exosortase
MQATGIQIWSERWRLAALSTDELIRIGFFSLMAGMVYVLFHVQGNTTQVEVYTESAFAWMLNYWNSEANLLGGADYSHGYLIPWVSLGVLWLKRHEIANAPREVCKYGLAVIVLALLMHWLGAKAQQTRLSLMGLILLAWGIPLYFYGWKVAKLLIFPAGYLIFCIPMNFLDQISFPLRMFAASASTSILNGLGIEAEQQGSAIRSAAAGGFDFDVADPCSGIRSLLAMTALTAVYAYLTQKTLLKKWILFLCAIPLAIIGNMARIATIALVAQAFGSQIALTLYHDYSGYVVFGVAIGCMVAIGSALNVNYKEAWQQWKHANLSPISSSSA